MIEKLFSNQLWFELFMVLVPSGLDLHGIFTEMPKNHIGCTRNKFESSALAMQWETFFQDLLSKQSKQLYISARNLMIIAKLVKYIVLGCLYDQGLTFSCVNFPLWMEEAVESCGSYTHRKGKRVTQDGGTQVYLTHISQYSWHYLPSEAFCSSIKNAYQMPCIQMYAHTRVEQSKKVPFVNF